MGDRLFDGGKEFTLSDPSQSSPVQGIGAVGILHGDLFKFLSPL